MLRSSDSGLFSFEILVPRILSEIVLTRFGITTSTGRAIIKTDFVDRTMVHLIAGHSFRSFDTKYEANHDRKCQSA